MEKCTVWLIAIPALASVCPLPNFDLHVAVTDKKRSFQIQEVKEMELNLSSHRESKLRYFMHQHNRHIWHAEQGVFIHVLTLNKKITISVLMDNMYGINKRQQNEL